MNVMTSACLVQIICDRYFVFAWDLGRVVNSTVEGAKAFWGSVVCGNKLWQTTALVRINLRMRQMSEMESVSRFAIASPSSKSIERNASFCWGESRPLLVRKKGRCWLYNINMLV